MISVANSQPAPCPTCNVRAVGRRPKSKVLVVLPPTYRSAYLDRLLLLARDAYDNEELDIMDMNIQFAWIGPELIASAEPGMAAVAALPAAVPVADAVAALAAPAVAKVPAVADTNSKPSKTAASAAASAPVNSLSALQGVAATGIPFEEQSKRNSQSQAGAAETPTPAQTAAPPKPAQLEPKKPMHKPEPKPADTPATPAPTESAPAAAAVPADQKKINGNGNRNSKKPTAAPAANAPAAAKQAPKPASAPTPTAAQPKPAPAAPPAKPASSTPAPAPAPQHTPSVSTSSKPSTPEPPKPSSAPAGPSAAGLADWIKQGLRTLASASSSTGAAAANDDDTPAGPITEHCVRVTNFLPTVQDYQMTMLLPPSGVKLHKVEFHPAEHNEPNFKLVRSATYTFASAHEADTMAKWIKDKNAGGQLGKLFFAQDQGERGGGYCRAVGGD